MIHSVLLEDDLRDSQSLKSKVDSCARWSAVFSRTSFTRCTLSQRSSGVPAVTREP